MFYKHETFVEPITTLKRNIPMIIRRYHRVDRQGTRIPKGLIVANLDDSDNETVSFGWSLCDNHDHFSYEEARRLADERQKAEEEENQLRANLFNNKELLDVKNQLPHTLHRTFDSIVRQLWSRTQVSPLYASYREAQKA